MRERPSNASASAQPKTLEGQRFTLVPFEEKHVTPRYVDWLNDPEVNRFLEKRRIRQTHETMLAYVRSFYGDRERYIWGIYPSGSADLVGTIVLDDVNHLSGFSSFGVTIGEKEFWGKGASTEAIELVTAFAFETLGLRRLSAAANAPNFGMLFTFKQLGFTLEGKLRQACLLGTGEYVDTVLVAVLADEWRARGSHATR